MDMITFHTRFTRLIQRERENKVMIAYKAFRKDMVATLGKGNMKYKEGVTYTEDKAKCANYGMHCAEDPLDTLNYYSNMDDSVYYIVEAGGTVNEDGRDTRISCTSMRLTKKLDIYDFVTEAVKYMYIHPQREPNSKVKEEVVANKWFGIARGKTPRVKGKQGTVIAVLKEYPDSCEIEDFNIWIVGQGGIKEDAWYGIDGEEHVD